VGRGFSHDIKALAADVPILQLYETRRFLAGCSELHFFFFAVPFSLEDFASLDDFDSLDFESAAFDSAGFESEDLSSDFAELPSPEPSTGVAPEFLPL
jgi:hypothetical protein